jgi:hypothetical protein
VEHLGNFWVNLGKKVYRIHRSPLEFDGRVVENLWRRVEVVFRIKSSVHCICKNKWSIHWFLYSFLCPTISLLVDKCWKLCWSVKWSKKGNWCEFHLISIPNWLTIVLTVHQSNILHNQTQNQRLSSASVANRIEISQGIGWDALAQWRAMCNMHGLDLPHYCQEYWMVFTSRHCQATTTPSMLASITYETLIGRIDSS